MTSAAPPVAGRASETIRPAPPPAQVPLGQRIYYGLGAIAYGVKDNGFQVFLLIYLNQVMGLDPGLVGLTLLAVLVLDALFDPLVGHWSDGTRTQWGRRHPFLYASALPIALFWGLLWMPPAADAGWVAYAWVFGCALAVRMALSLNEVPSLALLPEMTSDPHERTAVLGWRYLFGWIGGLVTLALAYGVFHLIPVERARVESFHLFAWTGAIAMFVAILLSAWGTHRRYAHPVPASVPHPALRDMVGCIRFRPFRVLLVAAVFGFASQGVTFALTNYMLGFVWRLSAQGLLIYALILGVGVLLALALARQIGPRLGKRRAAQLLTLATPILAGMPYVLHLFGLLPDAQAADRAAVFFAFVIASTATGVAGLVIAASMMADVASAYRATTGQAREGVFFAGQWFTQKCVTGLGIFLVGQMLVLVGFPANATAGEVAPDVLRRLIALYIATIVLLHMGAAWALSRFPLDERHLPPVQE